MILNRLKQISLLLLLIVALPVLAQDPAPDEYPTVLALEKARIPERDRVQLAQDLLGVGDIPAPPATPIERRVGDVETFFIIEGDEATVEIEAELLAIGEHIYIWVDTRANVSRSEAEDLAQAFDEEIYDGVRMLWGSEATPGIDGDPRVHGLFAFGLGSTTLAYYSSEHTYPREVASSSNEREMFVYNLDNIGSDIANSYIESTTAHEFQHMVRDNVNPNTDTWLNEGFSVFTEVYLEYPNADEFAYSFIAAPGTQLNSWSETNPIPNYGAGLMFVAYFYDRFGLDAVQMLSADERPGLLAVDNTLRTLGEPGVDVFFADWVMANILQDTSIGDGRYGYTSLTLPASDAITFRDYPRNVRGRANQYSADYFSLGGLPDSGTLQIDFQAPETVQLIPTDAYSGDYFWYSNRADQSNMTLTRTFDLSGIEDPTLNYQVWYDLEELWDYGYLMISDDDGDTWTPIETPHTTDDNPYGNAYGDGYSGRSGGWIAESVSLADYAGEEILVRFQVITDDAINRHGFAIDDVQLGGYFSNFELNNGGWHAEGWILIDNVLPQNFWIQAAYPDADGEIQVMRWQYPQDGGDMTLPLTGENITLAISPFAPLTTVATPYTLTLSVSDADASEE